MTESHEYVLLPIRAVPYAFRCAVSDVLMVARRDLRLPPIVVRYYLHDHEVPGAPWPRVVVQAGERTGAWVSIDRRDELFLHPLWTPTARTLMHECRHLWQLASGARPEYGDEQAETDAESYALEAMQRLGVPELPDDMPRLNRPKGADHART